MPDIQTALNILYTHHGRPIYRGRDDILGMLVRTILSQQTTSANASEAFGALVDRFEGDWHLVAGAAPADVQTAISIAGLAAQKGPRIQELLTRVYSDTGAYDLEHLHDWDPERARAYLTNFKGVGPKTAAYTLMAAAGMPLFPMDTHILRICRRLGWIDVDASADAAHRSMEPRVASDQRYAAHVVLVRHGRLLCHARHPDCAACPLQERCPAAEPA